MNGWLLSMLINLLFTMLMNNAGSIDWAGLLAKADAFVNAFIPRFWWPYVDGLIAGGVAALQAALADTADIAAIFADLKAGDWNKALADLKALLSNIDHSHAPLVAHATGFVGMVLPPPDVVLASAPASAAVISGGRVCTDPPATLSPAADPASDVAENDDAESDEGKGGAQA